MADQPLPAAAVPAAPAAPVPPAAPAAPAAEPAFRPRTWWQWILLYPAVGLALVTALPDWVDRGLALLNGIRDERLSVAVERGRLFKRNAACITAPYRLYPEPTRGRKIDATLCPTGDIYIRVLIPDEASDLAMLIDGQRYRESSDIVSLEKFLDQAERFAFLEALSTRAEAAVLPKSLPQIALSGQGDLVQVQDQFVLVICQKFLDDRTLLRHLQVQGQCFDETVDTYNGVTVSRVPVPCRPSC